MWPIRIWMFPRYPEVAQKAIVINGTRWPNELCFPTGRQESTSASIPSGIYSEEAFQSMFNFPIISGDPSPLSNPNNLAISEKTGHAFLYGTENPIGKVVKIDDHL
jgi:hypothetical protein